MCVLVYMRGGSLLPGEWADEEYTEAAASPGAAVEAVSTTFGIYVYASLSSSSGDIRPCTVLPDSR